MAEVSSAVFDDKAVRQFLKSLSGNAKNIKAKKSEYANLLSAIVFRDIQEHFENQAGPNGKWAKWSDIYAEHMRKIGKSGNRILQDSGHLRQSFIPTNYRSVADGILWFNKATTKGGFPYAAHHDETAQTTRKFMYLSNKGIEDISIQTLQYLMKDA